MPLLKQPCRVAITEEHQNIYINLHKEQGKTYSRIRIKHEKSADLREIKVIDFGEESKEETVGKFIFSI